MTDNVARAISITIVARAISITIAAATEQVNEAFRAFGASLASVGDAFRRFDRELRWTEYLIDTCRSPLSEALRPW